MSSINASYIDAWSLLAFHNAKPAYSRSATYESRSCKDESITIFAQEYAASHGASPLEEASYHKFDCSYEQPFAFYLHMQSFNLDSHI